MILLSGIPICIKRHRALPFLSLRHGRHSGDSVYSVYVYGFGFDLTNNDHKPVRMTQYPGVESDFLESDVKFHSLARNYWRSTGYMQCVLRYPETNWVFVSGALHWIAPRNVMSDEIILVLLEISLFGNVDAESPLCSNLRHKTKKKNKVRFFILLN